MRVLGRQRPARRTKGQVALLAAAAETSGAWVDGAIDGSPRRPSRRGARRRACRAPGARDREGRAASDDHGGMRPRDLRPRQAWRPASSQLFLRQSTSWRSSIRFPAWSVDAGESTKIYARIVQRLAALMQDRVGNDYVFRTDLRLRPDPGSTPVALSIDAALAYYESRGQNWERAAWIKARPLRRRQAGGRRLSRGTRALCLAPPSRLRHHRRHPGDEAPDQHFQKCRRGPGRGAQRQARARRHPRDRVFRPDAAAHRRRAATKPCGCDRPPRRWPRLPAPAGSPRRRRPS